VKQQRPKIRFRRRGLDLCPRGVILRNLFRAPTGVLVTHKRVRPHPEVLQMGPDLREPPRGIEPLTLFITRGISHLLTLIQGP
jgi:hypothetical protein